MFTECLKMTRGTALFCMGTWLMALKALNKTVKMKETTIELELRATLRLGPWMKEKKEIYS